jgi:L-proline amide hydrolase
MRDWTVVSDLHKIQASTLVLNGSLYEAYNFVVAPFLKFIPKVKSITFAQSTHIPHLEETERYLEVVGGFLMYE